MEAPMSTSHLSVGLNSVPGFHNLREGSVPSTETAQVLQLGQAESCGLWSDLGCDSRAWHSATTTTGVHAEW